MIFETGKIYFFDGENWGEVGGSSDSSVFALSISTSMSASDITGASSNISVPELSNEQILAAAQAFKSNKVVRIAWHNTEVGSVEYYDCQMINSDNESNNEYHLLLGCGSFTSSTIGLNRVEYITTDIEGSSGVAAYYYPLIS